ncbi:MAG: hypothetical protein PHS79_04700 [Patescibacteria group bacterium]|nr:hypothetical protein [Patescibacteria group bacterium]
MNDYIERTGEHTFLISGDAYIIAKEIERLYTLVPPGTSISYIPTLYHNGHIQETMAIVGAMISLDAIPIGSNPR